MKFLAAQSERLPYGHSEAAPKRLPLRHVPVTDRLRQPVLRRVSRRSSLTRRCGSRRPGLA
jgi:hypothetical protein